MHAALVVNHHAGSVNGDRDAVAPEELRDALRAAGVRTRLYIAPPRKLDATLREALNAHADTLFVAGGDGTINAAASHLAGSDIALGALPLGTLNHFARDLGVPADWREAVAALAGGQTRPVDVGEVNGRVFINNCSLGSYAAAVRKRDTLRRTEGGGKWWAMIRASLAVWRQLRRMHLRIDTNGRTLALRTPFVLIANNRYSGHVFDHSLRSTLNEGRLWIYTTRAGGRLGLWRLVWQALLHKIDLVDGLEKYPVEQASIIRERGPLPVALDGEVVELESPLRFRVRPGALRTIAPAEKFVAA